jgi:hypothetical protein
MAIVCSINHKNDKIAINYIGITPTARPLASVASERGVEGTLLVSLEYKDYYKEY